MNYNTELQHLRSHLFERAESWAMILPLNTSDKSANLLELHDRFGFSCMQQLALQRAHIVPVMEANHDSFRYVQQQPQMYPPRTSTPFNKKRTQRALF